MAKLHTLTVVALLLLCTSFPVTAEDALTVVVNRGIAPLKFEDDSGGAAGLLPDLWRLWAEKSGAEIRFVLVDSFQESLQLVRDGEVDLHAGLFKNAEREVFLDYSSPVLEVEYYIFTHPDLKPIQSLDDVSGFFLGVPAGGRTEDFVRPRVDSKYLAIYDGYDDLFDAVINGEIRAFVATRIALLYYLKTHRLPDVFGYHEGKPLFSDEYRTATKKGNRDLMKRVDDGLRAIGEGEMGSLEDTWLVRDEREIPFELASILTEEERAYLARHKTIRIDNHVSGAEPYNFVENGRPSGFSIDFVKLVAEKTGLEIEHVTGPTWPEYMTMFKQGELDVLINIAKTSDREAYMSFTTPYITLAQRLFTRTDFPKISAIEDLYGKRLAMFKLKFSAA